MVYEKETVRGFSDLDSTRVFQDFEFRRCRFESCHITAWRDPDVRPTVRDVRIERSHQTGCGITGAVLEDVCVNGLETATLLQVFGAAFRRVVLRGRINRLMISPLVSPGLLSHMAQRRWDEANAEFYSGCDWALDISEAEFKDFQVDGIPARLIRRDPETQVVVRKKAVANGDWRRLDLRHTTFEIALEDLAKSRYDDTVLVAPKRAQNRDHYLAALRLLREAGIAEDD
jgi:hypothetical protein